VQKERAVSAAGLCVRYSSSANESEDGEKASGPQLLRLRVKAPLAEVANHGTSPISLRTQLWDLAAERT